MNAMCNTFFRFTKFHQNSSAFILKKQKQLQSYDKPVFDE